MKTIEERAKEFCEKNICVECGNRKNCDRKCLGYCIPTFSALEWLIQFGKSQHAELTRWNDPKKELPPIYENVMVKYKASDGCEHITIAWRSAGDAGGYIYAISGTGVTINSQNILGWREIQE